MGTLNDMDRYCDEGPIECEECGTHLGMRDAEFLAHEIVDKRGQKLFFCNQFCASNYSEEDGTERELVDV